MRKILTALAIITASGVAAQNKAVVADDRSNVFTQQTMNSAPFSSQKYVSLVSGHPYYSEAWMRGTIITLDSAKFENLTVRLDLNDNKIIYKNDKNEELVSVAPVKAIWINDPVVGRELEFEQVNGVFYLVLTDGPVKLYKQYFKKMVESKAYASSITEQSMMTDEQYFVGLVTGMARLKKPKDLASVFPGKSKEISDLVSSKKLNGKKESDYIEVVEYYNSITK